MRALLFDVGNTRLKWGVSENDRIVKTGDIAQQKIREQGLSVLTTRLPTDVDAAVASNVAGPTFATRLAGLVGAHCNRDLHFARSSKRACGVENRYREPRRLGVDRWVAMIGAWDELGRASLVVDAGTAVTIDAIDDDGRHLGGMIMPGMDLMAAALDTSTSDIPAITIPKKAGVEGIDMFAGTTRNAVTSGVVTAVTGAVERAFCALDANSADPGIVLTGGDASRILPSLDAATLHRPNLVLSGLLCMLEAGELHPR